MTTTTHRNPALVALGFACLVAAAFVQAQTPTVVASTAKVHLQVIDPTGDPKVDVALELRPPHVHVLGALQVASRAQGFNLELQDYGPQGTMVVQIFQHRNQGSCGWVYDVNGDRGLVAADHRNLADGDRVRWSWDCEL